MKKNTRLSVCLMVAIGLIQTASAQIYSQHIVGYVNRAFGVGSTLFNNPLENSANNLSTLFGTGTPEGTTISLWNTASASFGTTSTYSGGAWSLDLTLNPGTGCLVTTPTLFWTTFVGYVDGHDGNPYSGSPTLPSFSGSAGAYLLGDKEPLASVGSDIFLNLIGRLPNVGEQVVTLTGTSTYLGNDTWDVLPTLAVSEAVFLNLGVSPSSLVLPELTGATGVATPQLSSQPVPEPGTLALAVLSLAVLPVLRRRKA